jgi:hypothetical protein
LFNHVAFMSVKPSQGSQLDLDVTSAIASNPNARPPAGAALLDAVRSNGWSQLCFRLYSRDTAEVAAERTLP